MKNLITAVILLLAGSQSYAISVSVAGGKKPVARSLDNSGNPLAFSDDKSWKVFENAGNVCVGNNCEVQVTDESSVAPKQGILHKFCIESGLITNWASVMDTSAQTGSGSASSWAAVTGRKLFPALYAATAVSMTNYNCSPDINAVFTAGLRVLNSDTAVRTYIYWRGFGDRN